MANVFILLIWWYDTWAVCSNHCLPPSVTLWLARETNELYRNVDSLFYSYAHTKLSALLFFRNMSLVLTRISLFTRAESSRKTNVFVSDSQRIPPLFLDCIVLYISGFPAITKLFAHSVQQCWWMATYQYSYILSTYAPLLNPFMCGEVWANSPLS